MITSNLYIEKNRHLLHLEQEDDTCVELLSTRLKMVRFDILSDDPEGDTTQLYRVKMTLDALEQPKLELKDYRDNSRQVRTLSEGARFSDAFVEALAMAWDNQD